MNKIDEVMKQLGLYIVALTILSSCANQGNIAQYEDDGIYSQPAASKSATPDASDAYYFVDEDGSGQNARSGEYYGNGESASTDDYVPEARSLPSESGQAYNNQRYNSPTYSSAYTSNIPVTMRMGYSSFHSPYAGMGMGMGVGIGMGYGYMGNPWWGSYYDPFNPWGPYYGWNRWSRWNMWYSWNMWTPYGPYGSCFGGYGMGFNNGFYAGVNSYNWGESSNNNTYNGPRPPVGGSFGNVGSNSSGFSPRNNSRFTSDGRGEREGASPTRGDNNVRTPNSRTPDEFRSPNREPSRANTERRPTNPNATRTPQQSREREPFFRWNNGNNSRTPDYNRGGSQPNRGYTPPSRGGSSPSARPGNSRTPNSYSRPSTPSRSPSTRPSTPSRSPSARPSTPSRSSSPSRSSGGSSRGGRR